MGPKIVIPPGSPFTIENIPFGVIKTTSSSSPRCASAIGDYAVHLELYAISGNLSNVESKVGFVDIFGQPTLNAFAALPRSVRRAVRLQIRSDILERRIDARCLIPLKDVEMCLPMAIGGYTDYYCSIEHVRNCHPNAPESTRLPLNWWYSPSVYNSRASSVVPSGTQIRRPHGIYYAPNTTPPKPAYGPSQALDFELEMGYFVASPVSFAQTMDIADAKEHIFGFVLLNDWSARDLQMFEKTPLGPFHGKGFGTSISGWVVTIDALEPFNCDPKTVQDPAPFSHLRWPGAGDGTLDIKLKASLIRKCKRYPLATSNLRYLYWTPYQQLTHHASAGCGMRTGDLIGTGTVSGDAVDTQGRKLELGCLWEATETGTKSVMIVAEEDGKATGEPEVLQFLLDGDEIVLEGWCGDGKDGGWKLGFGECRGAIGPAATVLKGNEGESEKQLGVKVM